ncbi:MAG: LuxR family transcriptional regulator [Alphaproteobacteria bacterium]|nr:MAG: LuxR family transcriptional regulator [Alphaproteobacteria bacterium]
MNPEVSLARPGAGVVRRVLRNRLFLPAGLFQAACGAIFIWDVVSDRFEIGPQTYLEILGIAALALGAWLSLREHARLVERGRRMEAALRAATGAFQQVIERHFDEWGLTPAERDVALLMMKGASIAEIAAMRNTREGTVRAQNAAIYRKAGVSSRAELLGLLIDELVAGLEVPALAIS